MTPRKKLISSLVAVPAALALLLTLVVAASPPEPGEIGLAVTTANEPAQVRWMVASYNGTSGTAATGTGSEANVAPPTLYIPRADLDSTVYIQNPVGSADAFLAADFYDTSGVVVLSEATSIPPNGSLAIELDSLLGLPQEYEGSVILESDQPIQAVVNIQPDETGTLLSYSAVETADGMVVLPAVARDLYSLNSSFWVQNTVDSIAHITVTYYALGGVIAHSAPDSIPPYGSRAYHLTDVTDLGAGFAGLALIESSQPLATAVETTSSEKQLGVASRGIPLAHGDPTLLAPRQQRVFWLHSSSLIANLGTAPAHVEADWYAGDGSHVHYQEDTVLPHDAMPYPLLGHPVIPDGFDGSLVISGTQPLGGIVRWQDMSVPGDSFAETLAVGLGQVGDAAYLPHIVHSVSLPAYTELSIQNAADWDTSVTAAIAFYDQSGVMSASITGEIPYHGVSRYATGDVTALGDEWQGSVIVTASQPIAVEVLQFMGEPSTCPVVTDPGDNGPNTLRDCLERASDGDTITFDPAIFPPGSPVTIALTSGPFPTITQNNLTLDASTAGVILDGGTLAVGHGLHITSNGTVVQGMQIQYFPGDGVRLDGGASLNLVGGDVASKRNTVRGNDGAGVLIAGIDTLNNTVTRNSIYGNSGPGIDLVDGGNAGLSAPSITSHDLAAGTASGIACAHCTVELFSDEQDEGRWFEDSTTAEESETWSINKGSAFHGPKLTATSTHLEGNTSQFGRVDRYLVYLPLVARRWPICTPDPPGESDNIDDALTVCSGQTVSGRVSSPDWDDDDVYKIWAVASQQLTISMYGSGGDADLYLFPPGSTDVYTDEAVDWSDGWDNDEYIHYTTTEWGFWYIDVFSAEGTTNYNLTITLSGPGAAGAKEFGLAGANQARDRRQSKPSAGDHSIQHHWR